MNKPIRRVSVFCMLLVLALMARANWLQGVKATALANDKNNKRVVFDRYAHPRGNIFLANGRPMTKSTFVNGLRFKYKQDWTDGEMYAPVTGYSSQTVGNSQIESLEDDFLSGNDDRLFFRNTLDMLTGKPKQGGSVVTTIDQKAQKAAYEALKGKKGAAVALDPTTGAVLALVSTPSYDPGKFSGQDTSAYTKYLDDPDKPMLNRALRETYPPGSTFKIVTAAAMFENHVYNNPDDRTNTPARYLLPNTQQVLPNESKFEPCTNATVLVAMEYSCNTVFAKIGDEVGKDKLAAQAEKLGFNNPKVDTPVRAAESVFPRDSDRPGTALDAIGQHNTRVTPLQMAMVASAVANNGSLMQPYMVDKEQAPDLTTISQTKPKEMSRAFSPETAQKLQTLMQGVVESPGGTGRAAQIPGVTVGGKTGTAQHGENNKDLPYAWFISYAKSGDTPKVAVAVVVESSEGDNRAGIAGGKLAAPVAKAVMEAVLGK
ncbi:penicillin-binding protein 2 [Streptacidiphilus sp. ASG 303]|uniref:peptidoglycan D,D-transpeptidase FtsI family protein n=1 Tax=Streptacidiphilus sp. ASG 303 TaxID=2896847 RepID=UPI001E5DB057|nr:penicillin-binding protein 2 [Streptacidiphilus sp. ASG 303]MCD0482232.1 penicillin-binding protein 2 [Streptacidiphilus sp. ASG 303]